ncbi:MAG: hypothetical protein V1892_03180 [bacterium]
MEIFNHQKEQRKLIIINFLRLLFSGLVILELFNYLRIFQFSVEYTWLGLLVTSTVSWILLESTAYQYQKKERHRLHWLFWLIILAALSLDAAGDFFHFYGKFDWWDQFAHLFISAVVCFTLFVVISAFWIDKFQFSLLFRGGRLKLSLFLAATSTISLSALYEIEEYLEDIIFKTHRLGPGTDTANDLLFNLLGVLLVVIFMNFYYLTTHKRKILD